ncbi:putative metalloprotease CJM1_0395 family protein [Dongia mobilis]|uniref:putative metalloprotease CJM1_0395 family protein n=1 Tax=Dongia sp. TaxID=1977262 RepID=UPI0026F35ECB
MSTIGSLVNNGPPNNNLGQVIGKLPGGAPGTETLVVRKLAKVETPPAQATAQAPANVPGQLSESDRRIIAELQQRDREVRNEEERHAATAGQYAGVPQYTYKRGPDGKLYAVEGKVPITVNVSGTAEDRERALRRVQAAAVSVQSPSSGDINAVAGAAAALVAQVDGAETSPAERRQQAVKAYQQGQATQEAAGLAAQIFGAIADQQV